MLFNSIQFFFFFFFVYLIYWIIPTKKVSIKNLFLLVSSYYFYSCWDWRFSFLLLFSTCLDFFTGFRIYNSKNGNTKKFWFILSLVINLGFLGVFKYYNFFIDSFSHLLDQLGFPISFSILSIVLPVGISFYTFHGISYVIDIYKNRIKAERNIIDYSLFVSFFPLLVAGPIERATHLLPQIKKQRVFSYSNSVDGLRQILWGFFKKIVIADNCAQFSDMIFNHYETYNGVTLLLGAVLFSLQIYGDFSGYSDIALGSARLLGFELLNNFKVPYFSRDIAEFWRRWHISLSSWFRDYVYIPLGGSRGSTLIRIRNTFIIFLLSGFWHGANWTFIVWGFLHALFFIPMLLLNLNRNNIEVVAQDSMFPSIKELVQMLFTFLLVTLSWIFFRLDTIEKGLDYFCVLVKDLFSMGNYYDTANFILNEIGKFFVLLLFFFLILEWLGRRNKHVLEKSIFFQYKITTFILYFILLVLIIVCDTNSFQFVYFQF
jgi:alginate O-acetyltransferase complex protein AlgI